MASHLHTLAKHMATSLRSARIIADRARHPGRGHPRGQRKAAPRRALDLTYLSLRYGNPNYSPYYAQGLDRKGRSVPREFMPYYEFRTLRNAGNVRTSGEAFDHRGLLEDKLRFHQYFTSPEFPLPHTLGILDRDLRLTRLTGEPSPGGVCALEQAGDGDFFCKQHVARMGAGAFRLGIKRGHLLVDGREQTPTELKQNIKGSRYLLQKAVQQHDAMGALHPPSVNTLRVVTILQKGGPSLFSQYLRIGVGGRTVDYSRQGTLLVAVATDGLMQQTGFHFVRSEVTTTRKHPDTGVVFTGHRIPFVEDCIDIAMAAHGKVRGLRSVGWDFAITAQGPVLLEGNHDWGGERIMWVIPDFVYRARDCM